MTKSYDHPRHRYPVGSLLRVDVAPIFEDPQGVVLSHSHGPFMPLEYQAHPYPYDKDGWVIFGLLDGAVVRSCSSYIAGEMMMHFTMLSNIDDAVEAP